MRKVLIVVVVLAVLLVVGDRVAAHVAAGRVEQRLADEGFSNVDVTVHGFPFLTQVARRELRDVTLQAGSVHDKGHTVVDVENDIRCRVLDPDIILRADA